MGRRPTDCAARDSRARRWSRIGDTTISKTTMVSRIAPRKRDARRGRNHSRSAARTTKTGAA
ncbi:MAG: hypothetical protein D6744_03510 [Planctomycetota bacterium]|nr:MAG: hypothetical protein D6744_03510 [Planctomycetota bacterium]